MIGGGERFGWQIFVEALGDDGQAGGHAAEGIHAADLFGAKALFEEGDEAGDLGGAAGAQDHVDLAGAEVGFGEHFIEVVSDPAPVGADEAFEFAAG